MDPITGEISELPEESEWIPVALADEDAQKILEEQIRKMETDSLHQNQDTTMIKLDSTTNDYNKEDH